MWWIDRDMEEGVFDVDACEPVPWRTVLSRDPEVSILEPTFLRCLLRPLRCKIGLMPPPPLFLHYKVP